MKRLPWILLATVSVFSCELLVSAAETVQLRVISWNMESGDSSRSFLRGQMAQKHNVDIWGLSEVKPNAFRAFRQAHADGGGHFDIVRGTTGNDDRLAVIFNSDKFALLGQEELTAIQRGRSGLRAPLVAHLRHRTSNIELLFMVNHLLRGDAGNNRDQRQRIEQAQMLNEWAANQVLPAIIVGDFNADFNVEHGDSGDRAPLFDELIRDDHLYWVRPTTLLRTQFEYDSVLDFVFLVNRDVLPGLTGTSRILNREGDSVATAATYDDNAAGGDDERQPFLGQQQDAFAGRHRRRGERVPAAADAPCRSPCR